MIRRAAYRIPTHRASHWLLLMLGERVDALESRPGLLLGGGALLLAGLGWRVWRNAATS